MPSEHYLRGADWIRGAEDYAADLERDVAKSPKEFFGTSNKPGPGLGKVRNALGAIEILRVRLERINRAK